MIGGQTYGPLSLVAKHVLEFINGVKQLEVHVYERSTVMLPPAASAIASISSYTLATTLAFEEEGDEEEEH